MSLTASWVPPICLRPLLSSSIALLALCAQSIHHSLLFHEAPHSHDIHLSSACRTVASGLRPSRQEHEHNMLCAQISIPWGSILHLLRAGAVGAVALRKSCYVCLLFSLRMTLGAACVRGQPAVLPMLHSAQVNPSIVLTLRKICFWSSKLSQQHMNCAAAALQVSAGLASLLPTHALCCCCCTAGVCWSSKLAAHTCTVLLLLLHCRYLHTRMSRNPLAYGITYQASSYGVPTKRVLVCSSGSTGLQALHVPEWSFWLDSGINHRSLIPRHPMASSPEEAWKKVILADTRSMLRSKYVDQTRIALSPTLCNYT